VTLAAVEPAPAPASITREGEAATAGTPAAQPKSRRRALFYSLLLPGLGELYLGDRGRATGFFIAEGLIWASYAAWQYSGHLRTDDYIEQAQLGAGVGTSDGADDYWRLVGQYVTSSGTGPDAYEEALRREARNQYPDDPAAQDQYVADRLPVGDEAWSWSTAELQEHYRDTRENANRAYDRADYSFGFAVLNRLLSAIDTQIVYRKKHRDAQGRADAPETRILTSVTPDGGGALLIQRRF
jgi:hypothetical protein